MVKTGNIIAEYSSIFKWKIQNYFSLSQETDTCYDSPDFQFADATWYVQIAPNGVSEEHTTGWIDLYLYKKKSKRWNHSVNFVLSIKDKHGKDYVKKEFVNKHFGGNEDNWGCNQFLKRSTLLKDKMKVAPNGFLTMTCIISYNWEPSYPKTEKHVQVPPSINAFKFTKKYTKSCDKEQDKKEHPKPDDKEHDGKEYPKPDDKEHDEKEYLKPDDKEHDEKEYPKPDGKEHDGKEYPKPDDKEHDGKEYPKPDDKEHDEKEYPKLDDKEQNDKKHPKSDNKTQDDKAHTKFDNKRHDDKRRSKSDNKDHDDKRHPRSEDKEYDEKEIFYKLEDLNELSEDLKGLFLSEREGDGTLKVNDRDFRIHKLIIGARAPVLYDAFKQDAVKNSFVEITDGDSDTFQDFLLYLYSGKVEKMSTSSVVNLYTVADKYGVKNLKKECAALMEKTLSVDTFGDVISLAVRYGESPLTQTATEFFMKNVKEIIVSVKWQIFLFENPISANELYLKAWSTEKNSY